MKLNSGQKSWLFSIAIHAIVIFVFTITIPEKSVKETRILIPIDVQIIENKPQKKVFSKKLVAKKAAPKAKVKPKPTSLPGDRVQPSITKRSAPIYPKKALNNDWQGTVKVKVTISSKGTPVKIEIITSSGHSILDQSFVRAIRQSYKFKPKRTLGENKSGTIVLTHTFSLEDS